MLFCLAFYGCGKQNPDVQPTPTPKVEETASFTITYSISSSNGASMDGTKASSSEIFSKFYEKICDGTLVAPSYDLAFTETTSGKVTKCSGNWAAKTPITLPLGTYKVEGTSTAEGKHIQDKCSILLQSSVTIDSKTTSVTLPATYDCYLLIFCDSSIKDLKNYNGSDETTSFGKLESYHYAFVYSSLYKSGCKDSACIKGTDTNGVDFTIPTGALNYEKGKYYVYTNISTFIDIDPMEPGQTTVNYVDEYGINHGEGVTIDGITWAPVNCGYKAASQTKSGYEWGKLYQWGRKYGQGYGTPYSSETSGDTNFADETTPTIAAPWTGANENSDPDTHYYGESSNYDYDWITAPNNTFWNSGTESNPVKTKYDPCPSGWRVPTATELRTLAEGHNSGIVSYDGKNGIWFSGSVEYSENVDNKIFLPCAGERFWDNWVHHSGCCRRGAEGRYSSSTTVNPNNSTTNFYLLWFNSSTQSVKNNGVKAAAKSIRCVQE